ncbi:hypothetical protein [Metasolibacillus sp. FSL K6-0083]|uniref:hypothetical protein n=1 Tax=Metasolibacillus sp. FSL K6-0083 TaxID=2921416 RepID=UPI00315B288E
MFIPFLKEAFSVYMNQHFAKHHRYCPKCRLCTAFWTAPSTNILIIVATVIAQSPSHTTR